MSIDAFVKLRALQHPQGGFLSIVTSSQGDWPDLNGFVAAMVLRLLRHVPNTPEWADIRHHALDWLWSCRSRLVPGAFAFWPEDIRPSWALMVPADVDDTAIMLSELLRHGRLNRTFVLQSVCKAIMPWRVHNTEVLMLPPWVMPGSFFTWIAKSAPYSMRWKPATNIVDCCVNTNVIALMSQLEAQHFPGYDAAVQTVLNGLHWAGDDENRLASLTPYYPSLRSFVEAMEYAIECGADSLREGLWRLESLPREMLEANQGLCRSAYSKIIWEAPAINLARSIAKSLG